MGRIKRKFTRGQRAPKPLTWEQERAELQAKVATLEARVKTRDKELIKEYQRRFRQQERVNKVHLLLREAPTEGALKMRAIEEFAKIYADMMRRATDNRVGEALIQIGPHTISDMRIGGDLDEEKQPPSLWLTLPELEIRIRVDERIWPAGRMSKADVERILGRPVALIEDKP